MLHQCAVGLMHINTMLPIIVQMMENYLSTHHRGEWLAGPAFTAADIMMSYTLGLLTFTSQSPAEVPAILTADKYPVTVAYWDRLQVWHATPCVLQTCGSVCHAVPA